eukprot:3912959-Amphidinium_carterae.1
MKVIGQATLPSLGFEPRAFHMGSGYDTTTPMCPHKIRTSGVKLPPRKGYSGNTLWTNACASSAGVWVQTSSAATSIQHGHQKLCSALRNCN